MKSYRIKISTYAISDMQEAGKWYNEQSLGLGSRFLKNVKEHINLLKSNPENYSVRYDNVRCALIKKFPFLIHFIIDEANQVVEVFAVFHTSRSPKIWEQRTKTI
jgi:plasmid stabilization system protein ParE